MLSVVDIRKLKLTPALVDKNFENTFHGYNNLWLLVYDL